MFLSSSKDNLFGQPIQGQQEVFGVRYKGKDTEWYAAEGVYLPRSDKKSSKDAGAAASSPDKEEL